MDFLSTHSGLEYILARIIQDFMQFMRRTGLSTPQIHAILHIYHSQNGECGLSEICGLTDSSKPAASQLVERLVQQGWVQRSEDPHDRRNKNLRLTHKSLKLIQNGVTSNSFLLDLMTSLPAKQQDTVQEAFNFLAHAGQQIQSLHTSTEGTHA